MVQGEDDAWTAEIEASDIESFVIDAIRTKCISCKIDHLAKTVTVK